MLNYNRIEEKRKSEKIPKMEFYKAIGMTDSGYKKMIDGNSIKLITLEKIAEVLKTPIQYFLDIDADTSTDKRYIELLERYNKLLEDYTEVIKIHGLPGNIHHPIKRTGTDGD